MIEPIVFWGVTTGHRADLYVRLATVDPTDQELRLLAAAEISGFAEGPFREDAATLKSRAPLQSLGNDPAPLARATLMDPCFWSPWSPATYLVTIHLKGADEAPLTWRRTAGVRPLAARRGSFRWEGRRWVFRGVSAAPESYEQFGELSELRGGLCLTTKDYSQQLGAWATQQAIPIAMFARSEDLISAFTIAKDCPAVWTVVAPVGIDQPFHELKLRYAPNVLLGCWDEVGAATPAWADSHWGAVNVLRSLRSLSMGSAAADQGAGERGESESGAVPASVPQGPAFVAVAPSNDQRSYVEQRRMCDALQRECSPMDLAGFVVGPIAHSPFRPRSDR